MDHKEEINQEHSDSIAPRPLLELAEISVLLDSYDDIFSDFDPSDYTERTLSDDFLNQVRKLSRNKAGKKASLKLLIPKVKSNVTLEKTITKRLHSYFKEEYQLLSVEIKKADRRDYLLSALGILMMVIASYISYMQPEKYHLHFLVVLFEPGGWFLLWSGLDRLIYSSKGSRKELGFFSKMIKSDVKFIAY